MDTLTEKKEKEEEGLIIPPVRVIEGIIKTEVNLERLPYFYPEKNRFRDIDKPIRLIRTAERENVEIKVEWSVLPHAKYGRPNYFDRDVYRAIQEIINRKGVIRGNLVPFTYREICRIMGLQYNGSRADEIKQAVRRIRATEVESKGAFRIKGQKGDDEWLTDTFSIFSRIVEKGQRLPDGSMAESAFIELGSWYVQSIKAGYLKNLDLNYYFLLTSPLARALFGYLDVVFYAIKEKGVPFKKRYSDLCEEMLLARQKYKSKVLKILMPAITELKETQFLADFRIEDIKEEAGDWILSFYPGERYITPHKFNPNQEQFVFQLEEPANKTTSRQEDKPTKEMPAYDLVMYFHGRAGRSEWKPKKKELNQAQDLLDQYGEERSRAIVDFSFEEAPKSHFDMKFFGAILHVAEQYQMHLEDDFKAREAKKAKEAAMRRAREVKELYEAEVFGQVNAFKKRVGESGWKEYLEKGRAAVLAEQPSLAKFTPSLVDRLSDSKAKELVLAELGVPSLEDYAKSKGIDPSILKELLKKE